ncbi:MAG: hypothetical protein M3527_02255 [Actinomycetota bacterium]|nr:hypothetical protein [Acidimicrobiia bacterium]MDQ3293265.1 hypothetical protein [Actinomycetota bacterium]
MPGSSKTVIVDPVFGDGGASMVALARRAERYRTYSSHEKLESDVGRGLAQRHDSVLNFRRTGGRLGRTDLPVGELGARTSYFREEYAYHGRPLTDGIERFLHHEALLTAAREVHGRPVIEPSIAYANVMLPGQELAVHTDVPEFRGLNRKGVPQWLLVVMHHSGLFDAWRMPIATGIGWFTEGTGGELSLWPDGPDGSCRLHAGGADTAMVLDTDTLFHGVDPVGGPELAPPPVRGEAELRRLDDAGERWLLVDAATGEERAEYDWSSLRLSVSWKAYCFADDAERDTWRTHADDLDEGSVVDRLVDDLRARGVVDGEPARNRELGLLLMDTYVRFPSAA